MAAALEIKHPDSNLSEDGFTVVELMLGILIISIMGLATMSSIVGSYRIAARLELNYSAHFLAIAKAEELSSIKVDNLDASDSSSETGLLAPGYNLTFSRVTTITVNADETRDIAIQVSNEEGPYTVQITYNTTLSSWQ